MKKLLVLAAGYYYSKIIMQLVEAGFYVIAVDKDPNAAAAKYAHRFEPINIVDKKQVLDFSRSVQIDGVMAVNDFGTRTASFVSQNMGLVGLSAKVVEAANDKGLMRDIWHEAGIDQTKYKIISNIDELQTAVAEIGFPCVLKPTDCGGAGRGVSVINKEEDIEWAYNFAKPYVTNGRFIVETYLNGIELTVESITIEKHVHILAVSDKVKPDGRTRVATSLNYPAKIDNNTLLKVKHLVRKAALSIGINNHMAHTEVILTDAGPQLVEIGARGGGGHVFHTCIEAVSGFKAPVKFAELLTGKKVEVKDIQCRGAVYRFFNPPYGILKKVKNIDKAKLINGVLDIDIVKKSGDIVGNLENSLHRVGFVVTHGKDRKEAIEIADYVESIITFVIDPL